LYLWWTELAVVVSHGLPSPKSQRYFVNVAPTFERVRRG
jgi:hypothetical protein